MSHWSRLTNVLRGERVNRELDEELASHIEEAIAEGRDPEEARRALGSALRYRESSRDFKVSARLDSLRADAVFGFRQLVKNRLTSVAAIVSLALAIGACTAAFRLIDALLLRPLPVADPASLYSLTFQYFDQDGKPQQGDGFEYPLFRTLRDSVEDRAELLAISSAGRVDLTYGSDFELEQAWRQYVSGRVFPSFGLEPAAGRLLGPADDDKPGAHPYAVLSYDYWMQRFGGDPGAVGKRFRLGDDLYEIVGVAEEGFTGTETGTVTDIFIPTMMNADSINNPHWSWFRTWVRVKDGTSPEQVQQRLQASFSSYRSEAVKDWGLGATAERKRQFVEAPLMLESAAAGVSGLQKDYRRSLLVLGAVVLLVLLIACANVANLLTTQAAARAREMALRVSIGAGRGRLVRLVLVESALIALAATALGAVFAWWSAPLVVSLINPPSNPARLTLPADWRVLGFAAAMAAGVTLLFGLAPALRASTVQPVSALKGGEDPHSRKRLMSALVAVQVAFCFLVQFLAGLFITTFSRLEHEPTGFVAERVLTLATSTKAKQPHAAWEEVKERLSGMNGVESTALASWPLMGGNVWVSGVWINHELPPGDDFPYFLAVSRGWLDTMKIPLLDGRDFAPEEVQNDAAIVNEAFAKRYFDGENPVGKAFEIEDQDKLSPVRIVGYARDALYEDLREPARPTVYLPFNERAGPSGGQSGAFIVRTKGDPLLLATALRREITRLRPEFRVSTVRTQTELVEQHTIRERLLAMLSTFLAALALLLAVIGLYGVLSYSVVQRKREIGIRLALGASGMNVAKRVISDVFALLPLGALAGLGAGLLCRPSIEALLYAVKPTDFAMLALPVLTVSAAAAIASLQPLLRALRIQPAITLRSE